MKSYWILFLCLTCLLASGCSGTRKRQVSALERENSQLNGLLWEMEFQLESLEEENDDLKQRLGTAEEDDEDSTPSRSRSTPTESTEPAPFDPGQFRPPVIEFPSEPAPDGTVPDSLTPGGFEDGLLPGPGQSENDRSQAAPVSLTSLDEPALLEPRIEIVPPEEVSLESDRIERIELATLIGTLHTDDKPGDDGLVIVVEPWDGSDQMLADAADISVVLIDPNEPAETARFAQWQFEAKEAAKLLRDGDLPGLHLELPWPGDPPRHDNLHLFVRYTTSDGRNLEADTLVEIELGGRGRWVGTETPRVRPYEEPIAPTERPGNAPQLYVADSRAAILEPAAAPKKTTIRTVSAPRLSIPSPELDESVPVSRPRPISQSDAVRSQRAPVSEPQSPARQRPVWSPDRPW